MVSTSLECWTFKLHYNVDNTHFINKAVSCPNQVLMRLFSFCLQDYDI
ncbi:Uncharacterised protein [Segatella copri]|nr:Uncharacterised protein [Segatella copri]